MKNVSDDSFYLLVSIYCFYLLFYLLLLRLDTVLKESLQEYVTKGINKDFQRVQSGSNKPPMLQKLLVEAAGDLQL